MRFYTPILFLFIILVPGLFLLVSCSKEEPIKIGFIGGLSGRVADLGISGRNGSILAVERRNNKGGIHGRKVQLLVADDKQDKQTAHTEFQFLIAQGVHAIIGHMTSSMSVETVPLANKKRIVMMSPTSTSTILSDKDDYFFRVCETTDVYGTQMARYFRNKLQSSKITVIYDLSNKAYTESWINHFSEEFTKLGGEIVQRVTYTSTPNTHFTDIVNTALQNESDGIIISSSAVDAAMICQQIRKINNSLIIGTSEWAATERFTELGGGAVEGVIVSQFFDRYSTKDEYIQFKNEFLTRFKLEPGFGAVSAYDATNVLLDTLAQQKNKSDVKQKILEIGTFKGIQGEISFNKFGDSDRSTYISTIRKGKFVSTEM